MPARFEAVAEALAAGTDFVDRCAVVGQHLAHDGASVEEALAGLRETWRVVTGVDPTFDAVSALLGGWSEATLGYLNHLSCTDPLTGLASQSHLRSCLADKYRAPHTDVSGEWALVMCQIPEGDHPSGDRLERSLEIAGVGEHVRTVFAQDEVVARLGVNRVAALTRRDTNLGRRVRLLRLLLNDGRSDSRYDADVVELVPDLTNRVRVWIEGLPHADGAVGPLFDELSR
ncbi:MAG: hypothetical protein ACI379_03985 [Nocardioides sp.]|uniref:hypothetical protein n=1 Tax=Nocardioides sp. TaxID=35761 RepID=UPI003F05A907